MHKIEQFEKTPPSDQARLLIVDDEAAIRSMMLEFMQALGYRARVAAHAKQAMEMLDEEPADIVITDIMMPGMDGLELTETIKSKHDVDIIVMTGYAGDYSYEEVIHKGASDFIFKPVRFEELRLRLKRVLRERNLKHELEKLAITDDLTQLFNARYFYQVLQTEVDRSSRYGHALSLLLLDIDYFKKYNDTYGHLEGNHVLTTLGGNIRSCLRRMDSAYRYGGEEFVVILPDTDGKQAVLAARRISRSVRKEKFKPAGKDVGITVSIGISQFIPGESIDSFIRRADMAMYASKQNGRNRITLLDSAHTESVSNALPEAE